MIKIFLTADIHIGKTYDRYPEIKDQLIQSRFDCLENTVRQAEAESCDFFVIAGDLFDNISAIKQQHVGQIVDILSKFGGRVIVLPGNHDYYTGEEKVWQDFEKALGKIEHNIVLAREMKPLTFETGEETITFYPAYCRSKHAQENNLGWIKSTEMDSSDYHVGIAHGALAGLSPDIKNEYFLMSEKELNDIPVDVWLIGHTHIPYPAELTTDRDTDGYKIYNPGTPEQTDLSNRTEGNCFIIKLDKSTGKTVISARRYISGKIHFFDMAIDAGENGLKRSVEDAVRPLPDSSVLRLAVWGAVSEEEYADKQQIYDELLRRFLTYEIVDEALCERITPEKIRAEFAEFGFAATLLNRLDDPKEIQMAYELIKRHQD